MKDKVWLKPNWGQSLIKIKWITKFDQNQLKSKVWLKPNETQSLIKTNLKTGFDGNLVKYKLSLKPTKGQNFNMEIYWNTNEGQMLITPIEIQTII